ncbi:MAG TPA: hypothetical protein VMF11_07290 [Candidatus Baltobacteraceae bacterium]|nr:hypothetical protein [Candidatus Baltobacteraceae bacterium]
MKALFAFIFRAAPAAHNDSLRANQFDDAPRFSPWRAMLPHL